MTFGALFNLLRDVMGESSCLLSRGVNITIQIIFSSWNYKYTIKNIRKSTLLESQQEIYCISFLVFCLRTISFLTYAGRQWLTCFNSCHSVLWEQLASPRTVKRTSFSVILRLSSPSPIFSKTSGPLTAFTMQSLRELNAASIAGRKNDKVMTKPLTARAQTCRNPRK